MNYQKLILNKSLWFILGGLYCTTQNMHSAYLLYGSVAGWVSVRHTPVLYQNGKTYLKTFSTIW